MENIQSIVNDAAAWITVGGFLWHFVKPFAKILLDKLKRRRRRLK